MKLCPTASFVSGFVEPKTCSLMVSISCPVFLNIWVLGSPGSCMVDEAGLRFGKTTFSKVIIEVIVLKRKFRKKNYVLINVVQYPELC